MTSLYHGMKIRIGCAILFLFLLSCAEIKRVGGKDFLEWDADAYPTMRNIGKWNHLWDGQRWIVGFARKERSNRDPFFLKQLEQRLHQNLIEHLALEFSSLSANRDSTPFGVEVLVTRGGVEGEGLLEKGSFARFLSARSDDAFDIAIVTFPPHSSFLDHVSLRPPSWALQMPSTLSKADPRMQSAWYQYESLARLPKAEWAEPNLISFLNENNLPKIDSINTEAAQVLRRMQVHKAYSWLNTQERKLAQVNVAVLDTGVDHFHPKLKGQMWVNPHLVVDSSGAILGNSNTGYFNDIHGIDATLAKGVSDPLPDPIPGSADLGGPGSPCPQSPMDELGGNCGHGTHVAGIVAGLATGDTEVMGICPTCRIMSLRVAERIIRPEGSYGIPRSYEVDGGISDVAQIRALNYLLDLRRPGRPSELIVNVVNMSLGKYFRSRAMAYLIRNLQKRNVIIVAAAGNDNTETPSYPAAYGGVVAVCALGGPIEELKRGIFGKATFSNFGDWVDICAPGTDIRSSVPGLRGDRVTGLNEEKSGTSQATPFVAGAIGMVLSFLQNDLSAPDIISRVKSAARSQEVYSAPSNINAYEARFKDGTKVYLLGSGLVDLEAAVKGIVQNSIAQEQLIGPSRGCIVQSVGTSFTGKVLAESLVGAIVLIWVLLRFGKRRTTS